MIAAGRKHRRDAEDFGKQTATVELRCDHDNSRIGKGGSRYWVCVHLGDAESPEVPDASFETPKECGKYEEVFGYIHPACSFLRPILPRSASRRIILPLAVSPDQG